MPSYPIWIRIRAGLHPRIIVVGLALALPGGAAAWEFRPVPVCTLSHDEGAARVVVTFDPRRAQPYAIAVTGPAAWDNGDIFALRFEGPRPMTLTTGRYVLADGNRTLTVTDTGFGNVLDGLEFNARVTAQLGDMTSSFALNDAAPEVRKFRDCTVAPAA